MDSRDDTKKREEDTNKEKDKEAGKEPSARHNCTDKDHGGGGGKF